MEIMEKSRETRLRRTAERRGLILVKSRRRDPRVTGYGRWFLFDARLGHLESPERGLTLDEVETRLEQVRHPASTPQRD